MLPIVAGILTAMCFAVSVLASARASRLAGSTQTVAGVMVVGAIIVLPVALIVSPLPAPTPLPVEALVLATLAGAANVGGLLLAYAAYRIGAVGIISTIGSTEGAIAGVISVLAGQTLAPGSGLALAVVAFGVILAATSGGGELEEGVAITRAQSLRAAALSGGAACLFGSGLFVTGHISTTLSAAWIVLPGRLVGVLLITVPLLLRGRLHIPRVALKYIAVTGLVEVLAFATYTAGARENIALTSVLTSTFAPVAAVAAFVLFRERLAPRQILGIVFVVVGISVLGVLTA